MAANYVMPPVLWTQHFLEAQGYEVRESVIHQDSQSAILLEKNCYGSSDRWTQHINTQYFFATDHIKKGDVS